MVFALSCRLWAGDVRFITAAMAARAAVSGPRMTVGAGRGRAVRRVGGSVAAFPRVRPMVNDR
jgi:hypothetical protein